MNTSQNDSRNQADAHDVDDLTRFLDEDFDTEDVDLFEFTSEEDSPLTQLKSIILSLDWEITDEILQDLAEEIENLKNLGSFANDKVAQVYLQGLDKIGQYIHNEGAHTHRNAIKLLFTFYYDFEKILSSEHITGAEITALLKADVRKFKILQHQIAQKHGATESSEAVAAPLPIPEHKTLQGIQASILELDWEVTDQSLTNMSEQLDTLKSQFSEDRYLQIIIQGLHTLNTYISEERARTHPEAFTLLHNFYNALERIVEEGPLEEEERRDILVDCINRLNNLKALIVQTYPQEEIAPEAITPVTAAEKEDADSSIAEKMQPEELVAADMEPPAAAAYPVQDDDDEDELLEFDETSETGENSEIAPALADSQEESGFSSLGETEVPSDELTDKLDSFFGSDEESFQPEAIEKAAVMKAAEEKAAPEAAREVVVEEDIAPALAGSPEETGFAPDDDLEATASELSGRLASFFDDEEEAPVATAFSGPDAADDEEIAPALGDEFVMDEEQLTAPALEDDFAGEDEDQLAPALEDEYPEVDDEDLFAPALHEAEETAGFGAEGTGMEAPPDELAERFASFFGDEEIPAAVETAPPEAKEEAKEEEEEEVLLTSAFKEPEIETVPAFAEPAIITPTEPAGESRDAEQYQAALDKIRTDFIDLENSLRQQINTLQQEVENLRSRLG